MLLLPLPLLFVHETQHDAAEGADDDERNEDDNASYDPDATDAVFLCCARYEGRRLCKTSEGGEVDCAGAACDT